jgi:hypothetical protein
VLISSLENDFWLRFSIYKMSTSCFASVLVEYEEPIWDQLHDFAPHLLDHSVVAVEQFFDLDLLIYVCLGRLIAEEEVNEDDQLVVIP